MMRPRTSRPVHGFTLIELMIVVAIIGILASIAIPNFLKFQCKSKVSEALAVLDGIRVFQMVYLGETEQFITTDSLGLTFMQSRGFDVGVFSFYEPLVFSPIGDTGYRVEISSTFLGSNGTADVWSLTVPSTTSAESARPHHDHDGCN